MTDIVTDTYILALAAMRDGDNKSETLAVDFAREAVCKVMTGGYTLEMVGLDVIKVYGVTTLKGKPAKPGKALACLKAGVTGRGTSSQLLYKRLEIVGYIAAHHNYAPEIIAAFMANDTAAMRKAGVTITKGNKVALAAVQRAVAEKVKAATASDDVEVADDVNDDAPESGEGGEGEGEAPAAPVPSLAERIIALAGEVATAPESEDAALADAVSVLTEAFRQRRASLAKAA